MKKIVLFIGAALASTFALASCGNDTNTTTTKDVATTTAKATTTTETTTNVETTTETTTNVETTTDEKTETTTKVLQDVSIVCPSGTPALGLANYKVAYEEATFDIVNGSDPLIAAFSQKTHDIIVAPVNLGAKFYNTNGNYVLAKTFVWGNLFLASKSDLTSFDDINGKKLVVFGKNSTPDIITQILKKEKNLEFEVEYVEDVATANSLLVAGTADYVITAEPAISKIKDAKGIKVVDLQEEYKKVTGRDSYPQAGIFVKAESKNDEKVLAAVESLIQSVNDTIANPEASAANAVTVDESFNKLGIEALTKAIPNCHFNVLDKDKEKDAVNTYLQYLIDLGFGKQTGDKLPGEEFFL